MPIFGLVLTIATILSLANTASGAANATLAEIFQRPVFSRVWQYHYYTLESDDGSNAAGDDDRRSLRVDIAAVAAAIAGLKPTYVSSTVRLTYGINLTDAMISDFNTIRTAVLAVSPNAKFDVELNLDPSPLSKLKRWPSAEAITAKMSDIDAVLRPDGWWFDFYSGAARREPGWITAINTYAHDRGQTVGGNIGGGLQGESWVIPAGADAVSFTDMRMDGTGPYGFGIDEAKLAATKTSLEAAGNQTFVMGHLRCDPQHGASSAPCVFMHEWNATRRASYLAHWARQQATLGFTMMWPVFFPLCPGRFAYDATHDVIPRGSLLGEGLPAQSGDGTVYDFMRGLALESEAGTGGGGTASPSSSSTVPSSSTAVASSPTESHPGSGGLSAGRLVRNVPLRVLMVMMFGAALVF
ncbi:hypothetical protein MN608_03209 [Microdochium nivale]|nr:hypothetical protein MN608_03209 [Microdochium nivale]